MKTKKFIWEPQQEEKLVAIIKKRNHIWNSHNLNFLNLRLRKKSFAEIALELGDGFTAKSVKERWTNIRNTYRHNLRRVEKTRKELGLSEDIYEPSWHLWDKCQFMAGQDYNKAKKKWKKSEQIALSQVKVESENAITAEDFLRQHASEEFLNGEGPITVDALKNLPSASAAAILARNNTNTSDKSACEHVMEEALNVLKLLENDPRLDLNIDPKFSNIGREVAKSLSKMKPHNAECASKEIMEILTSYSELDSTRNINNETSL